jgi:fatty acid amide hydrolase 2
LQLTSEQVVSAFIDRIEKVNPLVNCVVDNRFGEALLQAKQVDEYLEQTDKPIGDIARDAPLLGVPFTCKDSIAVAGLKQTIGLVSRKEKVALDNAASVDLLVEAGGIPLAVTNVPEVCLWWESVNPLHGRTLNAYDSRRLVGGSSGGEVSLCKFSF